MHEKEKELLIGQLSMNINGWTTNWNRDGPYQFKHWTAIHGSCDSLIRSETAGLSDPGAEVEHDLSSLEENLEAGAST